jgi:hypothetical protein
LEQAADFLAALGDGGAMLIKAVAGGGGRGMRVVRSAADLGAAFARARSEAQQAFGNGDLYAEQLMPHARHIEVQIIGDGSGAVSHLGERECRFNGAKPELAPCPRSPELRHALPPTRCAWPKPSATERRPSSSDWRSWRRLDRRQLCLHRGNAPLVEHTVTEETRDRPRAYPAQLAAGQTLTELASTGRRARATGPMQGGSTPSRTTRSVMPLVTFEVLGRGRTDTCGYVGYRTTQHSARCSPSSSVTRLPRACDAVTRTARAERAEIEGVRTNIPFCCGYCNPDSSRTARHRFIDDHLNDAAA